MAILRKNLPFSDGLKSFVRYCSYKKFQTLGGETTRNPTQADLWPSLVVTFGPAIRQVRPDGTSIPVDRVTLMGAAASPDEFELPDGSQLVGFNFMPGMAHPFFGHGLDEFTDRIIPIEDCWGRDGKDLVEQVQGTESPNKIKKFMEAALLKRLRKSARYPARLFAAVKMAVDSKGTYSIKQLAEAAECSPRNLKNLFSRWVGLGPKLFSRIVRFQAVCDSLDEKDRPDWAQRAFEYGYFDQSHLIRDFESFAGQSPARFFDRLVAPKSAEFWKALQPDGLTPA